MNATLLLVEDDPVDRAALADACADAGVAVLQASNGEQALKLLVGDASQALPPIKAIFLDLGLPRVDGHEVLRQVRREAALRSIPVVVFTGSQLEADVWVSYRLGANAYVPKPDDDARMRSMARDCVRFWTGLNVQPRAA